MKLKFNIKIMPNPQKNPILVVDKNNLRIAETTKFSSSTILRLLGSGVIKF